MGNQSCMTGTAITKAEIFIVEDDPIIAQLIEWRLSALGYSVCGRASNGNDAIEGIKDKKPDLALLDIGLAGDLDGIGVAHVLSVETDVPYVYLTSHDDGDYLERAKQTVPYGYIKKPFSDHDLRICIELALNR